MTVGEILIAILREMVGIPPARKTPPRRRARPPSPSPARNDAVIEPEVKPEPEWPAPPRPVRAPEPGPEPVRRITRVDMEAAYARPTAPAPALPFLEEERKAVIPISRTRGPKAALAEGFVDRLRRNPGIAREAFVYGEIFGPPKAFRNE
ncbi:MAG: hypothetical protein LBJ46_00045 [Planctomycetota bacterium]|jgi:hypothetical protein|nr:hypothetical protein [Planctomycetota bacterium]